MKQKKIKIPLSFEQTIAAALETKPQNKKAGKKKVKRS